MRDYEYYAGRAAADTLGYISGNLPGAVAADRFYQKIMAPTRRGSTATTTSLGSRRSSTSSASSRPAKKQKTSSMSRGSVAKVTGTGNGYQKSAKKSGSKVSTVVAGKVKRVSSKFRSSVKEALKEMSPTGYLQERFFHNYKPVDFVQATYDLGRGHSTGENATSAVGASAESQIFFDPVKILDAASVLYNGKTFNGNKNTTNAGQFDPRSLVVEVQKQWVRMEMKNNTARNLELKLFTWELKGNVEIDQNFTNEWANCLTADATSADGKLNLLGISQNVIGAHPAMCPSMKRNYKIEEKRVVLEPGKSFVHTVQGPTKVYDFSKFWVNNVFNNFQKGSKGCCLALALDVTATSAGGANVCQRFTDITAVDPFALLIETQYHTVLRMPDQAGFRLASATVGAQQALPRRRGKPYAIINYNQTLQAGAPVDIEDENPQNQALTGV